MRYLTSKKLNHLVTFTNFACGQMGEKGVRTDEAWSHGLPKASLTTHPVVSPWRARLNRLFLTESMLPLPSPFSIIHARVQLFG